MQRDVVLVVLLHILLLIIVRSSELAPLATESAVVDVGLLRVADGMDPRHRSHEARRNDVWRRFGRSCPGARAGLYACLGLKGDGDRLSLRGSKAWTDGMDVPPPVGAVQRAAGGIEALPAFAEARRV